MDQTQCSWYKGRRIKSYLSIYLSSVEPVKKKKLLECPCPLVNVCNVTNYSDKAAKVLHSVLQEFKKWTVRPETGVVATLDIALVARVQGQSCPETRSLCILSRLRLFSAKQTELQT